MLDAVKWSLGMISLERLNFRMEMPDMREEPYFARLMTRNGMDSPPPNYKWILPSCAMVLFLEASDEVAMASVPKVEGFRTPDRAAVNSVRCMAYNEANAYLLKERDILLKQHVSRRKERQSDPDPPQLLCTHWKTSGFFESKKEAFDDITAAVFTLNRKRAPGW
eukprot:jgi/Undpi1/4733/HiC_scaffold_18.g08086.m1